MSPSKFFVSETPLILISLLRFLITFDILLAAILKFIITLFKLVSSQFLDKYSD